jgi:hypothetical protein
MLAAIFALIEISRVKGFDKHFLPPIIDAAQESFKDWFANADKIIVPKLKHSEELGEHEDIIVLTNVTNDVSEKTTKADEDDTSEEHVTKDENVFGLLLVTQKRYDQFVTRCNCQCGRSFCMFVILFLSAYLNEYSDY